MGTGPGRKVECRRGCLSRRSGVATNRGCSMAENRSPATNRAQRLICHSCGQRFWVEPGEPRRCAECGGFLRHFGPIEGLVDRFFAPGEQVDSVLYRRHLQMVEALWT